MDKKELFFITEDILILFRGLRDGKVRYSFDNLHCAMKTDICEVFSNICEEFVFAVDGGKDVTKEQVQELHDNLIAFSEEFRVAKAKTIAARIQALLEASN